jgi:hypothetical protein
MPTTTWRSMSAWRRNDKVRTYLYPYRVFSPEELSAGILPFFSERNKTLVGPSEEKRFSQAQTQAYSFHSRSQSSYSQKAKLASMGKIVFEGYHRRRRIPLFGVYRYRRGSRHRTVRRIHRQMWEEEAKRTAKNTPYTSSSYTPRTLWTLDSVEDA